MAGTEPNREAELRQLLTDAIEVQLAALKAGIGFWSEWIEHTSKFVQSASKTLTEISSDDQPKDVLLELVDAGRESVRSMTEMPRHTASRFIEALDEFEAKKKKIKKKPSRKTSKGTAAKTSRRSSASRPASRARRGRVKT